MSDHIESWHRLQFKLQIYQAHGYRFEDLVQNLLKLREPDFQAVRPWGKLGDRGNDGWTPSKGHYYQLHAPQPNTQINEKHVIEKSKENFNQLLQTYHYVYNYYFVLNDRFNGIPAPVVKAIQDIKVNNCLRDARALGSSDLLDYLSYLSEDQKIDICGGLPLDPPEHIDSSAVGELLSYLADKRAPFDLLTDREVPDINNKIQFNGLSRKIGNLLYIHATYTHVVTDFFKNFPGDGQAISLELKNLYEQSKKEIYNNDDDDPDLRFIWIINNLIPQHALRHRHSHSTYQTAALTVMSTYFESCDIYEPPTRSHTS